MAEPVVFERRKAQFWQQFNDWWRDEYTRSRNCKPRVAQISRWYEEHAHSCWPNPAQRPTLEETKRHAKGLRPIGAIKEYFKRYREQIRKQGPQRKRYHIRVKDNSAPKRTAAVRKAESAQDDEQTQTEQEEEEEDGEDATEDEDSQAQDMEHAANHITTQAESAVLDAAASYPGFHAMRGMTASFMPFDSLSMQADFLQQTSAASLLLPHPLARCFSAGPTAFMGFAIPSLPLQLPVMAASRSLKRPAPSSAFVSPSTSPPTDSSGNNAMGRFLEMGGSVDVHHQQGVARARRDATLPQSLHRVAGPRIKLRNDSPPELQHMAGPKDADHDMVMQQSQKPVQHPQHAFSSPRQQPPLPQQKGPGSSSNQRQRAVEAPFAAVQSSSGLGGSGSIFSNMAASEDAIDELRTFLQGRASGGINGPVVSPRSSTGQVVQLGQVAFPPPLLLPPPQLQQQRPMGLSGHPVGPIGLGGALPRRATQSQPLSGGATAGAAQQHQPSRGQPGAPSHAAHAASGIASSNAAEPSVNASRQRWGGGKPGQCPSNFKPFGLPPLPRLRHASKRGSENCARSGSSGGGAAPMAAALDAPFPFPKSLAPMSKTFEQLLLPISSLSGAPSTSAVAVSATDPSAALRQVLGSHSGPLGVGGVSAATVQASAPHLMQPNSLMALTTAPLPGHGGSLSIGPHGLGQLGTVGLGQGFNTDLSMLGLEASHGGGPVMGSVSLLPPTLSVPTSGDMHGGPSSPQALSSVSGSPKALVTRGSGPIMTATAFVGGGQQVTLTSTVPVSSRQPSAAGLSGQPPVLPPLQGKAVAGQVLPGSPTAGASGMHSSAYPKPALSGSGSGVLTGPELEAMSAQLQANVELLPQLLSQAQAQAKARARAVSSTDKKSFAKLMASLDQAIACTAATQMLAQQLLAPSPTSNHASASGMLEPGVHGDGPQASDGAESSRPHAPLSGSGPNAATKDEHMLAPAGPVLHGGSSTAQGSHAAANANETCRGGAVSPPQDVSMAEASATLAALAHGQPCCVNEGAVVM